MICQEDVMHLLSANPVLLSIVIPAFNEAENIPLVVEDTMTTLASSAVAGRYELLLVNDGSSDDSGRIADALGKQHSCVRVLHHPRNLGFGEALKTGYKNSRGDYLTFIPADGEVQADQALKLFEQVGDATMITSTRLGYVEGNTIRRRSIFRGTLSWGYRLCIRMILGCNPEKLTGIYLVRGDIVRALPLHSKTSLVSLEIFMHCLYSGTAMKHSEITIKPRLSGVSKIANLSGIWQQFREMIQLRCQIRQHINVVKVSSADIRHAA